MLNMVSAEMSSSETDISAGEELKVKENRLNLNLDPRAAQRRKTRNWSSRRFWRSPNSNSSTQGSGSDLDVDAKAKHETTMAASRKTNRLLRLSAHAATVPPAEKRTSSAESLLTIFRNFSSSSHKSPSTPSSPQISDCEVGSSMPTPMSTPGSPSMSADNGSTISDNVIQVAL